MTGFELFYYFVLPVCIVAAGYIAMKLHERTAPKDRLRAGE
jgi:hypothetical protein